MQFNVSSLLKEYTGAAREYEIDDDVKIDGQRHRLTGRVRMDRTPDGILVRAELRSTYDTECSRCLCPVVVPITLTFEEEYIPTIHVITGRHIDLPEGREDAYRISARHILDLQEPVQQYWAIAVPMAPLCREDCAGLCPICGGDVSAVAHGCTTDETDTRWAKLAELKAGGR